jgi:hypothetical protein
VTPVLPPGVQLPEGWPAQRRRRPTLRSRRAWHLEKDWFACLAFPFRAGAVLLALGALLALDSVFLVNLLPRILRDAAGGWALPLAAVLLPSALLLGYVCAFLDGVLASGAAGVAGTIPWPGHDLALVLRSSSTWLLAFLAGPAELAVGARYYWLQAGELDLLDQVLLAELGFLTFGYWLFVLASVNQRERLADLNPLAVARLIDGLGLRAWGLALAASWLGVLHLLGLLYGLNRFHEDPAVALPLLTGVWISGLAWATSLLRVLGVWTYWSRSAKAAGSRSAERTLHV